MLERKQILILVPYLLLLVLGYFLGIGGWAYNASQKGTTWTFFYTMIGVIVMAVILAIIWMFSPSAKRNQVIFFYSKQ